MNEKKIEAFLPKLLTTFLLTIVIWAISHFIFGIGFIERWLGVVYLLIYFLVTFFAKKDIQEQNEDEKYRDWPISGPIGKFGKNGLLIAIYGTSLLSYLNPFQLLQILKQGIGNIKLSSEKSKLIDNANDYQSETDYILPFEKDIEWLVYNGGISKSNSHSWDIITQRFAYDFVIANDIFGRHEDRGTKVKDYYCYDQNILAVADGTVVKVVNNIRTAPFVGYGILDFLARSFIGNHIVIKHQDNEYSFYAHLIKGSIHVKKGERISQGAFLGKCGHSGYSSEPHLHFHLQNKPDFFFAKGLPIRFNQLKINGTQSNQSYISATDRVESV